MDYEQFLGSISSVGFPILVSVYLLTKFTSTIERLSAEVGRLSISIDRLDEREALRRLQEREARHDRASHEERGRDL